MGTFRFSEEQRSAVPLFIFLFSMAIVGIITFPIRALFLVDVLHGSAFQNGLSFAIPAAISVIIAPVIGSYSDELRDRRVAISIGLMVLAFGSALLAVSSNSIVFVVLTSLVFPFFMVANSQFFAWARERELSKFGNKALGSSELRVGYSAGWVLSPVLAGLLPVSTSHKKLAPEKSLVGDDGAMFQME